MGIGRPIFGENGTRDFTGLKDGEKQREKGDWLQI